MPAFVKTGRQEKIWKDAKKAARRGRKGKTPWALVTHIFGKMGGFKEAATNLDFEPGPVSNERAKEPRA